MNPLYTYNGLDAACALECRNAFWDELEKYQFQETYELTMGLLEPVLFMQTRGLRVDRAGMASLSETISKRLSELQEELNRLAGRQLNALSPKDCQQYFYLEKGIPPLHTRDGQVTTDDKALQRLARGTAKRPPLREASLVQEIRGLNKLLSTYLDIKFDPDGRLRCVYKLRGTKFGRLSSSSTVFGTGMNLQNLHPMVKRFIIPDDGYFFLEIDKRQAEWVVVAYLSGDPNMISVLQSGEDPHLHTASLMFKVPKELLREEAKLLGTESDPLVIRQLRRDHPGLSQYVDVLPRSMSGRQMGKKSNHALNYGEGYVKFSLEAEIDEAEAKRVVNLYHSVYPGVRQWHESVKRQLMKDRTLVNCFGRRIRFMDEWGDALFRSAYSALPQSTVVDGLNIGLRRIYGDDRLTSKSGYNIDILAQVHDSLLMQVPVSAIDRLEEIFSLVDEYSSPVMEYGGRKFRIATDMKVGLNWGRYGGDNEVGMKESPNPGEAVKWLKDAFSKIGSPLI